jgi:hypothetical protein
MNRVLAIFLSCTALLAGCASAPTFDTMIPASVSTEKHHTQSVSVSVSGGKATDAMDKPQISDDAFKQALTESITRSRVFSSVVQGPGGDYLLSVTLHSLDQPSFGLSFLVKMEAGWTLRRASGGAPVWQESIRSEFTATTSDSFAAVTRLRMATEGAARENIAQGLAKISRLNL